MRSSRSGRASEVRSVNVIAGGRGEVWQARLRMGEARRGLLQVGGQVRQGPMRSLWAGEARFVKIVALRVGWRGYRGCTREFTYELFTWARRGGEGMRRRG